MSLLQNIKIKKVLLHLLFWLSVWFFYIYFFGYNSSDKVYVFWFSNSLLPVTIFVTYLMVYLLIPKFLLTKQYWRFILYSFYTLVFSSYLIVLIIYASLIVILKSNVSSIPPMVKNFVSVLILLYLIVGLVSLVKLFNHNLKTISRNKELQNKILETQLQLKEQELHYLKRQIHPHFLFNTLNTIYGFALKQSKQTPEIILMLSNLLDYILYQINKPKVSLKEEVLHVKEYVELEKIRFKDTLQVTFLSNEISNDIEVAPMLLIPFVENAFKHGNIIDGALKIEINIKVSENKLYFSIRNTSLSSEPKKDNQGIGLENIKKRLDLNYKDNYKLDISAENNWFDVSLTISNLNSKNNA